MQYFPIHPPQKTSFLLLKAGQKDGYRSVFLQSPSFFLSTIDVGFCFYDGYCSKIRTSPPFSLTAVVFNKLQQMLFVMGILCFFTNTHPFGLLIAFSTGISRMGICQNSAYPHPFCSNPAGRPLFYLQELQCK